MLRHKGSIPEDVWECALSIVSTGGFEGCVEPLRDSEGISIFLLVAMDIAPLAKARRVKMEGILRLLKQAEARTKVSVFRVVQYERLLAHEAPAKFSSLEHIEDRAWIDGIQRDAQRLRTAPSIMDLLGLFDELGKLHH